MPIGKVERRKKLGIDWIVLGVAGALSLLGILAMSTIQSPNPFFVRQIIWLALVLVSGISCTHLFALFAIGVVAFAGLWTFGFHEYQKERILTFLHPLADVRGAGYNAFQSTIAVGSGQLFGKGIGYGTQS